ncbi:MAG: hypothetical protein ACREJB_01380, partial [Planctomycetaceae bacterium]
SRKAELETLLRKREKLRRELEDLDRQIAALDGSNGEGPPRTARRKLRRRARNDKPLNDYVAEILARNDDGLPLGVLSEEVLKAGYKTTSSNFKNVLYQYLYSSKCVIHDKAARLYRISRRRAAGEEED